MTETETETLSGIKQKLLEEAEEKGQVIVHCTFNGTQPGELIRIWRSTYLIPHGSSERSVLLHAENISMYPAWTPINGSSYNFTLFFSALPKDCAVFDLFEEIPQEGGFHAGNIVRNQMDVYQVNI